VKWNKSTCSSLGLVLFDVKGAQQQTAELVGAVPKSGEQYEGVDHSRTEKTPMGDYRRDLLSVMVPH